ncbi:hypothetical protein A2641_02590 [Candidatus Nomurabacteria bacterium RIFCSPHIGHO2_01_FULL_37_25]|uniref:HAD family hydrolase n=1 Tax=Candidatus Nomurabacteria bacterium RIFCSPLOWO2_01_FULL_36_16 TaxID=1801767 RepID=A0A1F6X0C6_9BACT|nr:MAG: hypothetical protein A2641_02590 [Candidatus Nomurabacteria bacterium RIFCSPHIGHO2_01_FULL_37_25]OGI75041.1 MAG: hypothetical protein A3D36_03335 [Candidatus Nomurabacteria bacterium RIFCSPHIGHO2_02_FULL_36_29]OGI87552.1 MAG: hypothetical protein A3A91_01405 [Candidatus Nomurabacteria bacterium RIFCSPLOWO2_01_FULL_36_16]OGI96758.1 MAG: hypothetical protein A3I84_02250 [Candidatus Nomurabacteria bacterium RIFCSPLOWO2_02_FULL_36_8]
MIHSIIFDWKRTLYDPDTGKLVDGSIEILELLRKQNIPLSLIGKGGEDMYVKVEKLGVKKYFKSIMFQEGAKGVLLFKPYISNENASATLFIGDRVRSELAVGKTLGATTMWIRQGKFADETPENKDQEPDYTVVSLIEAKRLLISLNN